MLVIDRKREKSLYLQKLGEFMTTIRQLTKLRSIKNSIKVVAASSIAIGVATMLPAVPAGAVSFNSANNQISRLTFGSNNGDFGQTVNGLSGNSFSVTFNTTPVGSSPIPNTVSNSQGAFSPTFVPGTTSLTSNNPVGIFSYQSGNLNSNVYR